MTAPTDPLNPWAASDDPPLAGNLARPPYPVAPPPALPVPPPAGETFTTA